MTNTHDRWVALDGAVNARDLGGLPTADGRGTRRGRVLRADNLQDLTAADLRLLLDDYRLKNVIDLRSDAEVELEGPGPLDRVPSVTVHRLSLFSEGGIHTDVTADTPTENHRENRTGNRAGAPAGTVVETGKALPWHARSESGPEHERSVRHYLGYLADRPDSVVAALRVMSRADGAALVHCAAGKDRTGVVCALALEAAGVTREAIVTDYAQTGDRLTQVLDRLRRSRTYAADLDSRPADSHRPHASIMEKFLAAVDERHGGTLEWLTRHGWTPADTGALRTRLITRP